MAIADYLDSKEMIAEYLNTVLEEGNDADVINAIGHIAKAIAMTKISEDTGLSRPSLYKALSDGSKPQFATILNNHLLRRWVESIGQSPL